MSVNSGCISFFFQAEDGIRDYKVTGVQTCALPISAHGVAAGGARARAPHRRRPQRRAPAAAHHHRTRRPRARRSEEHTSELQSPCNLVCRLLLEKKKTTHRLYNALTKHAMYWTPSSSVNTAEAATRPTL